MTDQTTPRDPRHPRRIRALLGSALVLVIAAVVVIALLTQHGGAKPAAAISTDPSGTSATVVPVATPTATASAAPSKPAAVTRPSSTTRPTPQATKTATIAATAPIEQRLTVAVTKTEAVQGKAQGPGEIAGPAVRFTVVIKNSTGKSVDLSDTVVNAYFGKQSTPAVELQSPGGVSFPHSVSNGGSARGVFVFTMPKDQRSNVVVTVDTSVNNPVVAFRGAAPQ